MEVAVLERRADGGEVVELLLAEVDVAHHHVVEDDIPGWRHELAALLRRGDDRADTRRPDLLYPRPDAVQRTHGSGQREALVTADALLYNGADMLREGLRAEFPEVVAFGRRLRRLPIPVASPVVGALYGVGIRWLSASLLQSLAAVVLSVWTGPPPLFQFAPYLALAAVAAAVAVTQRSSGIAGSLLFIGAVASGEAAGRLLLVHDRDALCERVTSCIPALPPYAPPWHLALGVLLGLVLTRGTRPGAARWSGVLLGAAVIALSDPLLRVLTEPMGVSLGEDSYRKLVAIQAGGAVAAIAAGVLVARFSRKLWQALAVFALAFLLPWVLFTVRSSILIPRPPLSLQREWLLFTPVLSFALLAATAMVGRAVRRQNDGVRAGDHDGGGALQ